MNTNVEENLIANISLDDTKVKALGGGFDSHCLHSTAYYPRIEEILGKNDGSVEWNKRFKAECKTNKELKELRQKSKPWSFKLAFLGHLDATTPDGRAIYDIYWDELYPGVKHYNETIVEPEAVNTKQLYMGLGLYLRTEDPKKDIRTLCNSTWQFWDIISLIALALFQ